MNRLKHIISACLCLLLILGTLSPVKTAAAENPVYILAIGNSFSRDAISKLREIGLADGMDLRVANLYIGGCSLETHWVNVSNNNAAYTFQTWYTTRKDYNNYSIKQALDSQNWDYVTFQQASATSGMPDTFEPYLTNLSNYVKTHKPNAKQYYHQTWAYEIGCSQAAFKDYGKNQAAMFTAIKNASTAAAERMNMGLIPCGEAMQKARATAPFDYANGGKSLCTTDKYHPDRTLGSYLLSSVWYEVLTGKSILNNTFTLSSVSGIEMNALKQSAHAAVEMYAERHITGISIQSKPSKTAYLQNEALDTSGGALLVSYSDGSKATVTMEKSMISGYNGNTAGAQTLTVTYNGRTAAFQVTVISRAAVDSLIKDINAIKSGTTGITQLNALKSRYDALSATEKAAVSNYSKLTGALAAAGQPIVTTANSGTSAGTSASAALPASSTSSVTTDSGGSPGWSETVGLPDSSDTETDASQTTENVAVTTAAGGASADDTVSVPKSGSWKTAAIIIAVALVLAGGGAAFLVVRARRKQNDKPESKI